MQLTLFTDYSMRALMYLAAHTDRVCTIKDISEIFGISHNHMIKVVHKLSRLGYIKSRKGKNGGLRLAKHPREINLRQLIIELEATFHLVECFNIEKNACHIISSCKLKNILHEALSSFFCTLEKYTLNDAMINPHHFAISISPPK
jgi:Rrf2 family nitric oxide-sensitive transcriptional repressor